MFYVTVPDEKLEVAKDLARKISQSLGIGVAIDEKTKSIKITPGQGDVYTAYKVVNVFKALGLGFSEDDAMRLLSDDYSLAVVDLRNYARNEDDYRRIKGRIIGENGKAKRVIQEYTGVKIVIGDKEVAILGRVEQVEIARRAVEMLAEGKEHSTVYKFLDKSEAELRFKG
mgnify:CR=1 FL=1